MYFAITGQTELGQEKIKTILRQKGHHVSNFVCENTDFLIANYPSNSRKYKEAIFHNTKIITEQELFNTYIE